MNRRVNAVIALLSVFLAFGFLSGCGSSTPPPPPPITITATGGTPQTATVGTAFASPLAATVMQGQTPVANVTVTFTAPGSGASCAFSGGATTTATTNSSGVASATCTANTKPGAYTVTASVSGATTSASFSLTNTAGAPASITATSGTPQSATVGTAFGAPLVATVVDSYSNPVSGATVTFTAPASGASGTFSNGTNGGTTYATTTGSNGVATSTTFTANTMAGAYAVTASASGAATPANFALTNTAGPAATINATGGTPQSATVNTAFTAPLVATVVDSYGNPVSGASVTFTAPASGAGGTFTNGGTTYTTTTGSNGVAPSTTFTANTTAGSYTVTAATAGVATPANFALTNTAGPAATITATGGTPQRATVNTAFAQPLSATVVDSYSNPVNGASVTFTAPGSGASGAFTNGTATETDTTNASGIATSTTFTANSTTGSYTVTGSVAGVSTPANFSLTNTAAYYSFYLSGQEAVTIKKKKKTEKFYALAGSVQIDPSGNVLGGEQDYNDGNGITSPQPQGDAITGGSLTVNSTTGQGTLTLNTNNTKVGVNGTETLGVQFVNAKHALLIQFDGSATSSGSLDLQTLPSTLNGGYAFTLSGVDPDYNPAVLGGVFSVSGTSISNGVVDVNDNGSLTDPGGVAFSATLNGADAYGRGTIAGFTNPITATPIALNYYIVGPEAIRIIDVDTADSAIGSAFGQGASAGNFNNASLETSVFAVAGNPWTLEYGALGQFTTSNTGQDPADFSGVGDDNELDPVSLLVLASPISGTYSIASNGYGSLTISSGTTGLGDVAFLQIYMTDPSLNLNDPNNTTGGGSALVLDMDYTVPLIGTGVVIPQTDTSTASFAGNYAVGWQNFNYFTTCLDCEFDMIAQGTMVAGGALSLTGLVSDPFFTLSTVTTSSGDTFTGTPLADTTNPGRYSMLSSNPTPNPLTTVINGKAGPSFDLVIYQASGGQLFWLESDTTSVFSGPLEQQGSLNGMPAVRKHAGKTQMKSKK